MKAFVWVGPVFSQSRSCVNVRYGIRLFLNEWEAIGYAMERVNETYPRHDDWQHITPQVMEVDKELLINLLLATEGCNIGDPSDRVGYFTKLFCEEIARANAAQSEPIAYTGDTQKL